jgi:hypothetical protein
MDEERNLGVTEARFALTILTCLLVAIGYIALLKLGGTKDTAADVGPDDVSPPIAESPPVKAAEPPPRVLPLQKADEGRREPAKLAKRPAPGQQLPEPELR